MIEKNRILEREEQFIGDDNHSDKKSKDTTNEVSNRDVE